MSITSTDYWRKKRKKRPDITDDMIEYCVKHSKKLKDRTWPNAWNALARIPLAGRLLKVVYREEKKTIKVITAYWLD